MRHNQFLPIFIQFIFIALIIILYSAAPLSRLKKQMHLCIMSERFIMTNAFSLFRNCFTICYISSYKVNFHSKSVKNYLLQNLKLYLAHKLYVYFLKLFIPHNIKLRLFFFNLSQVWKSVMQVNIRKQFNFIRKNRR